MYLIRDAKNLYIFEAMKNEPTEIPIRDLNKLNVSYIYSHATDYETASYRIGLINNQDVYLCEVKLELILK